MRELRTQTLPVQTAEFMRKEIILGRWKEGMPGRNKLAGQLGVSPRVVRDALGILEKEGVLVSQGASRPYLIQSLEGKKTLNLRVCILLNDDTDMKEDYIVRMMNLLLLNGHHAFFAGKSLQTLHTDADRVARLVKKTKADAWIVVASYRAPLVINVIVVNLRRL